MSEIKIPEKLATCLVVSVEEYENVISLLQKEGKTREEIIEILPSMLKITLETCD